MKMLKVKNTDCFFYSFFSLHLETANFVNMLFEALTNSSYMPQIIVEPTQVVAGPNTPKVTISQPIPNVNSTTPPEKPRKSSVSEDVLTPRVLAEVNVILFLIKDNFFNLHFLMLSIIKKMKK